jgi:hypothetical protein
MVVTLSGGWCAACQLAQCSASVASGAARTCATSAASSAGPMARGRPGIGLGASEPSRACWATQRCTVERPTAKRRATSRQEAPAAAAATTRSRRSSEYAFMGIGYHLAQPFRNLL